MAKRGRPRKTRPLDVRKLTDEQAARALVHYKFGDGTTTMSAKAVRESLVRQKRAVRSIQGQMGGRPRKADAELEGEILVLFSDAWLEGAERISFLKARENARAWVAKEIGERHPELSARTIARAVSAAIGPKKARKRRAGN